MLDNVIETKSNIYVKFDNSDSIKTDTEIVDMEDGMVILLSKEYANSISVREINKWFKDNNQKIKITYTYTDKVNTTSCGGSISIKWIGLLLTIEYFPGVESI